MADHIDHIAPAYEEKSLLSVGGEDHVAVLHGHGCADRDRFLTETLHVKREPALTLHHHHALVEGANAHHVGECFAKRVVIEFRIPCANGLVIIVEHAQQTIGEVVGIRTLTIDGGPRVMTRRNVVWGGE